MEKKIITWTAFLKMLENNHFDNLAFKSKQMIYEIFKYREFSIDEVYSIINGAKKKLILSTTDKKFVKLNIYKLVRENFSNSEIALYRRIDEIDRIFKEYFRQNNIKQKDYTNALKDCWALARRVNKTIDNELVQFTQEEFKTFEILAKLYRTVAEHVENESITAYVRDESEESKTKSGRQKMVEKDFVRVADYIVSTRLAELHDTTLAKLTNETVVKFDEFLKAITSVAEDNAKDTFSKEDVKEMLDKTISLITRVSADKYVAVRNSLNAYLETVMESYSKSGDKEDLEEFSKITAKNIVLKCSSVLIQTPEAIGFSLDFMMGHSMQIAGQTLIDNASSKTSTTAKNAKLLMENYPNLALRSMDLKSHLYFAKHSPYIALHITTSSLYSTTNSLLDMILIGLGQDIEGKTIIQKKSMLMKLGFNIDNIYTKDNIYDIFANSVMKLINEKDSNKQKNIIANVGTLSEYLQPNQLQKVFSHNFNLLMVSNDIVVKKIEEIKQKSVGNNKKFVKMFHDFLNDDYAVVIDVVESKTKRVKSAKSKISSDEELDIPERDTIIVEIKGKDITEESEREVIEEDKTATLPIVENNFDKVAFISEELQQLHEYVQANSNIELINAYGTFTPKSIAQMLSILHLNKKAVPKNVFARVLDKINNAAIDIESGEEISFEDKEYLISLVDDIVRNLKEKLQSVDQERIETDEMISIVVSDEKDKESRKKAYDMKLLVKKVKELKSNNLVAKKYAKLIDEEMLKEMMKEEKELSKAGERITEYRKMLHQLLEDSAMLSRERELIKMTIKTLLSCKENLAVNKEDSQDKKYSNEEIIAQIEKLKEQRELKVRSISIAYSGRIKANNFSLDELDKIVKDNPHGRRILAAVNKIDEQIAELEAILASNTSID